MPQIKKYILCLLLIISALDTVLAQDKNYGNWLVYFGNQKINIHVQGSEFEPKAHLPVPGALDLCFIVQISIDEVVNRLNQCQWPIVEGPVMRTGATAKINSVYVRDPDFNLIELSVLI